VTQFSTVEKPEAERARYGRLGARDETAYHATLGEQPEQNKSGGDE
jgi:hypothetical protein